MVLTKACWPAQAVTEMTSAVLSASDDSGALLMAGKLSRTRLDR